MNIEILGYFLICWTLISILFYFSSWLSEISKCSLSLRLLILTLTIISLYAIFLTKFISVLSIGILVLIYYWFNRDIKFSVFFTLPSMSSIFTKTKIRLYVEYFIIFLVSNLLLNWKFLIAPHYQTIFYSDTVVYAEIADYINLYKVENYFLSANLYEEYRYNTLYHYPEIYLAAFLSKSLNLPALLCLQFIVYPLLLFGILLSIQEVFYNYFKSKLKIWLIIILLIHLIGGIYIEHKGYVWWYDYMSVYYTSPLLNYNFNKFYLPFWIFLYVVEFFLRKNFDNAFLLSSYLVIVNFTLVAFGFSLMVLIIFIEFFYYRSHHNIKNWLVKILYFLFASLWLLYLFLSGNNGYVDTLTEVEVQNVNWGFAKGYIAGISLSAVLHNFVYITLGIITLIMLLIRKQLNKEVWQLLAILLISLIASLLLTTGLCVFNFFDYFQPFFNSLILVQWLLPIQILLFSISIIRKKIWITTIITIFCLMSLLSINMFYVKSFADIFNNKVNLSFLKKIEAILCKYATSDRIFVGVWDRNYELMNLIWTGASYLKTYQVNVYRIDIFVPLHYAEKLEFPPDPSLKFFFKIKPLVHYFHKKDCHFASVQCIVEFMKTHNIRLLLIKNINNIPLEFQNQMKILEKDTNNGDMLVEVVF